MKFRDLDSNHFATDLNFYLVADRDDLAIRFIIPRLIFVRAFGVQPPQSASEAFREHLVSVRIACLVAYERRRAKLDSTADHVDIPVIPADFEKAKV